ncbi:hypothetical protein V8E36_000024 [Tilletia maclaganii]
MTRSSNSSNGDDDGDAHLRAAHPHRALVHLINGDAFVWDVEDVKRLRTQHNIIGLMTGTLPLAPQQNVFLGLPLQLIPEEVTFLLRTGAIVLIDESAREREKIRRKQLLHHHAGADTAALSSPEELVHPAQQQLTASTMSSSSTILVSHPSSSSPHIHTTLASAHRAATWLYPRTPLERARCATFDDLHARGYFMGTGLRFGGEFVVYPGDPLRYHSHFSTTVLVASDDNDEGGSPMMSGLDLIASGRLGTAVKKAHLICAVDQDREEGGLVAEQGGDEAGSDATEEEGGRATSLPQQADTAASSKFEDGGRTEGRTTWGRVRYYSLTWSGFGT